MAQHEASERQREALRFIVDFVRTHGYVPTVREIGAGRQGPGDHGPPRDIRGLIQETAMQTVSRREPEQDRCARLVRRIEQNEVALAEARALGLVRLPARIAQQTATLRAQLVGHRRTAAALMAAAGLVAESRAG